MLASAIELPITGGTWRRLDFDSATAIPLPAAAWMGFALLGGMGVLRKRHKA